MSAMNAALMMIRQKTTEPTISTGCFILAELWTKVRLAAKTDDSQSARSVIPSPAVWIGTRLVAGRTHAAIDATGAEVKSGKVNCAM